MRGYTPNKLPQHGYRMPQKPGSESNGSRAHQEASSIYPSKDIEICKVCGRRKSGSNPQRHSNAADIPPALQMAMKVTRHSGKERGWEFLRAVSPYLSEQEKSSIRAMLDSSQSSQRRNTDDGQRQGHKESNPYENRSYQRETDEYDGRTTPKSSGGYENRANQRGTEGYDGGPHQRAQEERRDGGQVNENEAYRRPSGNSQQMNPMAMMNMLNQFMNMNGNKNRGGQNAQSQQSVPVTHSGGPSDTGNSGNRNQAGNSGNRNSMNNIGNMMNMMSGMMNGGPGNNSQGAGNMGNMGQLLNALRMMNQFNPGGF